MVSVLAKLKPLIVQPNGKHTATVILLHGSGSAGEEFHEWIKLRLRQPFGFSHIKLMFPNAELRPYMAANDQMMNVWFQRKQISPFVDEDVDTIQESSDNIRQLVEMEMAGGIKPERIIVGGFSMGGSMALYYGMRCGLNLAGIFALSSFLSENSIVYDDMEFDPGARPPLFQAHGKDDPLVKYDWGVKTHEKLKQYGVNGLFHTYPNLLHELNKEELDLLKKWINEKLPEL